MDECKPLLDGSTAVLANYVNTIKAGAYTRSLHTSTWGPSGHIASVSAQPEHLRDTSTG